MINKSDYDFLSKKMLSQYIYRGIAMVELFCWNLVCS